MLKRCNVCGREYGPDYSFCLDDGSVLAVAEASVAPVQARSNTPVWVMISFLTLLVGVLGTVLILRTGQQPVNQSNSSPSPPPSANSNNAGMSNQAAVKQILPGNSSNMPALSPAGQWSGTWSTETGALYDYVLTIDGSGDQISGRIRWTLRRSPRPDKQTLIGVSATEFVSGRFDPATRLLTFGGTRKDDPSGLLVMLDQYKLTISSDGHSMSGVARNGGKWNGKISLTK